MSNKRKVDVEKLTEAELEIIASNIQKMVVKETDELIDRVNESLSIYGSKLEILWDVIHEDMTPAWEDPKWLMETLKKYTELVTGEPLEEKAKPPVKKKRGRPPKKKKDS